MGLPQLTRRYVQCARDSCFLIDCSPFVKINKHSFAGDVKEKKNRLEAAIHGCSVVPRTSPTDFRREPRDHRRGLTQERARASSIFLI